MSKPCIYDRDDECLENCPDCPEFKKKCFNCGDIFLNGEKTFEYAFPKRGEQEICADCLFKLEEANHYKDFCEENEHQYRQYIIEQYE